MVSVFHDDTPAPFGIVVGLTGLAALVLGIIANRMNSSVADTNPVAGT